MLLEQRCKRGLGLLVLALLLFILINKTAIKTRQAMPIFWEMRRHPINDNPQIMLMALINKMFKLVWITKSAGGRKHPDCLITPRTIERKFRDRQYFDMGIAHFRDIGNQIGCQIFIT